MALISSRRIRARVVAGAARQCRWLDCSSAHQDGTVVNIGQWRTVSLRGDKPTALDCNYLIRPVPRPCPPGPNPRTRSRGKAKKEFGHPLVLNVFDTP